MNKIRIGFSLESAAPDAALPYFQDLFNKPDLDWADNGDIDMETLQSHITDAMVGISNTNVKRGPVDYDEIQRTGRTVQLLSNVVNKYELSANVLAGPSLQQRRADDFARHVIHAVQKSYFGATGKLVNLRSLNAEQSRFKTAYLPTSEAADVRDCLVIKEGPGADETLDGDDILQGTLGAYCKDREAITVPMLPDTSVGQLYEPRVTNGFQDQHNVVLNTHFAEVTNGQPPLQFYTEKANRDGKEVTRIYERNGVNVAGLIHDRYEKNEDNTRESFIEVRARSVFAVSHNEGVEELMPLKAPDFPTSDLRKAINGDGEPGTGDSKSEKNKHEADEILKQLVSEHNLKKEGGMVKMRREGFQWDYVPMKRNDVEIKDFNAAIDWTEQQHPRLQTLLSCDRTLRSSLVKDVELRATIMPWVKRHDSLIGSGTVSW